MRYGGSHGFSAVGPVNGVRIFDCDLSWLGGGVLSYQHRYGRLVPMRYGNGIQFWLGARNVEVFNNRLWQIYDTPLTNQGIDCVGGNPDPDPDPNPDAMDRVGGSGATASAASCAMDNISYHHNLALASGMACVEIWYADSRATMTNVRFENNLCANIGDSG